MLKGFIHRLHPAFPSLWMTVALLMALTVGAVQGSAAGARSQLITVASGPLGGAYYPVGVGIGEMVKKYVPGLESRVEVTGGTVENPALLQQGDAEIGIANAHIAYFAYHGMKPFPAEFSDLRGLFIGLAPGAAQYVVMADSGIRSIRDLKGKRVAVGPPGNSSFLVFENVLDYFGLSIKDVRPSYISFAEGVSALLDGHVDMAIVQAGIPSPAVQEAFAGTKKIQLMSLTEEERNGFLEQYPYFSGIDITSQYYPQLTATVRTIATSNMVMVTSRMDEETVYQITAAIFDHLDEFYQVHPVARWVTLEDAAKTPIPLHPGAARYFREKGVLEQ
ncbi:C4-dicarboxylate ABC transporter substrate-binding protein [Limnochorda pilosa]|uniref:C4-dicarboxylate ABC transporter substrate-binding protein n=2 Tax=Limnochorda pilosa TaxID=1555112 RepID=A0A0K2SMK8_LIMPI|nr:C4-dicarboxylate ABC transporter substrate-binding protein [Limnochorda pilosa]